MMGMMIVKEVWFDPNDDGSATRIRFSVEPQYLDWPLMKDGACYVDIAGPHGLIGKAEVRHIAFIKGLSILEVVRLLGEADQAPSPWPSLPALSKLPQEGRGSRQ